jgi:quercetin dioxygenase-like cupin family protein
MKEHVGASVLQLSLSERVIVRAEDATRLCLEVTYDPLGQPPPRHFHPSQDEDFEILSGRLMVDLDGSVGPRSAGQRFHCPAGSVHRMWNPFDVPCTVRWTVTPAGRTLAMFREIDALHQGGRHASRLALGRVVAGYGGEFRLAGPAGRLLGLLPHIRPVRSAVDVPRGGS